MNAHLAGQIDFCVLPGDNADDGAAAQYALIRRELADFVIPVHVIPGDHDHKPGDLRAFYRGLGLPRLPYSINAGRYRCLFLDVVSQGSGGPDFVLGAEQLKWLDAELADATARRQSCVIFMHAYPADLKADGESLKYLLRHHQVAFVDMGHTHYNELANDGTTIFATTRSTGQIEEGPVGFSLASLKDGVVSWRFKPLRSLWPFVMITSPADHRLVTDIERPGHVITGTFPVTARVFGSSPAVAAAESTMVIGSPCIRSLLTGRDSVKRHSSSSTSRWRPPSAASAPNATALVLGTLVALLSNAVNNLPLGLIAGTVASGAHLPPHVTGALLIGVDLGPNLSVTGSLATIPWLVVLRREGQAVSAWRFLRLGCVIMPTALIASLVTFIWFKSN
jgi:hypothetical protein